MSRRATRDDIPGILEIEDEVFRTDKLTRRKLLRLIARGNAELLVEVSRGRIVGYALVLFRRGLAIARLYGFAVRPSSRGRGIGSRLFRAAETAARRRGCRTLRLEVAKRNKTAVSFYEKMGYRRIADLPDYYEDHAPAWRLERRLARGTIPA